jgi:hypothetical protein
VSHAQKVTFSDALTRDIDAYCDREGINAFTDAIRELIVMGLALDWQRRHIAVTIENPFLRANPELTKP